MVLFPKSQQCDCSLFIFLDLRNFQISHVPSGRFWSYTAGQNSEQIILKGDCADEFTYDTYGGLKHVLSSRCPYIDGTTNYTEMQTSCDDWTVALIHKDIIGLMMIKRKSTNKAVMADGFGNKGEYIENETVSASTEQ